jgi:hypothetical protein
MLIVRKGGGMDKKAVHLSEVYRLFEPGPVVMVSTVRQGKANAMTMSWHTMIDFEPPLVECVISDRNYTFEILQETKECVINIPSVEMASKVVSVGNTSGRSVNKFEMFQLYCFRPEALIFGDKILRSNVLRRSKPTCSKLLTRWPNMRQIACCGFAVSIFARNPS